MNPLGIYIETSVFNFYFSEQDEEKRRDTLKLFEEIREGKYTPYASDAVLDELNRASEPKQGQMVKLIDEFEVTILPVDEKSERLADVYVEQGIIPERYRTDGLHIALTAVNGLYFIVSYNFQHIVKRKTIEMTEIINYQQGYKKVGIYSPTEVVEHEE